MFQTEVKRKCQPFLLGANLCPDKPSDVEALTVHSPTGGVYVGAFIKKLTDEQGGEYIAELEAGDTVVDIYGVVVLEQNSEKDADGLLRRKNGTVATVLRFGSPFDVAAGIISEMPDPNDLPEKLRVITSTTSDRYKVGFILLTDNDDPADGSYTSTEIIGKIRSI